ncbi:hypothetical protein CHRY9390_02963 [Chryseobacterium aquaeductus]|uniref:Uncharacterized protein n=1 Tax=Chryseobacterium aquaeductus TaxID=2675056 RepID=A0A9N8MJZ3_9FLAO|nr:hypothetical protein [Chryseobacterium aquaeductus]CAA7332241.1 hypothetical protein CHRY9390_02963 [Chryseobacterium potabilaquae]CAD7815379.1 hypothetical protein CHRY9390_02963 [Chryseobacterium aquaeductus]
MKKLLLILLVSTSVFTFAQQTDKETYIKKESVGGKLDFTKRIEEKYKDAPFIKFGDTLFNKKDFAILLWAANVRTAGIESLDVTEKLWEEINKRNLSDAEKKALKTGFEAKF